MSGGELIAIITAAGSLIIGVISGIVAATTARSAARKDFVASLQSTIESLQHENQRLFLRLTEYEGKLDRMEAEIEERDKRILVLESALRDATQGRTDREHRIQELETELSALQSKVTQMDKRNRGVR